jgi:5-methylcytosine-specific restriction enzyme subunit McrC
MEALSKRGILAFTALEEGLSIRSSSFVGRIELGDLVVTVRPKVAPSILLTLLRYTYSLQDLSFFQGASFDAGAAGLQDVLIAQLEAEARELWHRGLLRRYVRRHEELASIRGRIDVNRLARSGFQNVATVPCTHYPRSSDFLLNQVVRGGLELASGLTRQPSLRRALSSTEALYAEIAATSRIDEQVLESASRSLDRLSSAYGPILYLIQLLYEASHLDLEDGALRISGFMFDMNRFFQRLIGKFLTDSLPRYQVASEQGIRHMMAYARGYNPRGCRSPTPRPDFVVTTSKKAYLLDAKYRDLWRTDLPRDMLYQLAIYAMSQPSGSTAAILYPTEQANASEAIVEIKDPMTATMRARVALRPVAIPVLARLLGDPRGTVREREAWAEALVFGSWQ